MTLNKTKTIVELEQALFQSFSVPERPKTWALSPSSLSYGYASCVFKILDSRLPKKQETYKPGSVGRIFCGYLWELEYAIANPQYQTQVPMSYTPEFGYTIHGTADFVLEEETTVTLADTKCVASSVADRIKRGDLSLGYHRQMQWYMQMHKLGSVVEKEYIGKLAVLDRNYLTPFEVEVSAFTTKQWESEVNKLQALYKLIEASDRNDTETLVTAANNAVAYVLKTKDIHTYSRYEPHGNLFNWKQGEPESVKPKNLQRYLEALEKPTETSYRLSSAGVSEVQRSQSDDVVAEADNEAVESSV